MALVSGLVPIAVAFSSCLSTLHHPTTTAKRYKHGLQALHGLDVSSDRLRHTIRTSKSPARRQKVQTASMINVSVAMEDIFAHHLGKELGVRVILGSSWRHGLQILMQKGAGFGKQPTEVKTKHKILTLDVSKAEAVETYGVFARKLSQGEPLSRWESIGEILVNKGADVETALKERRKKLLAAAKHQYPAFVVLKTGEELEYGFQKTADDSNGVKDSDDIVTVNVKGKEPDISIPAILRADDGTKVSSPKRF